MDKKIKLKSRSRGLTTTPAALEEKKPLIGNEVSETPKADDPLDLLHKIAAYNRYLACATSRKERLSMLMSRRSAKKWDGPKKQKMVRRLMTAESESNEAISTLTALQTQLDQVLGTAPLTNSADFIPPPATSV